MLALVMVEKAGLGKHRQSREAKGFDDDGKVVDGAAEEDGHVEGGGGGQGKCPRRKSW